MNDLEEIEPRIPVILCHSTSWSAYSIFNPNDWSNASKPIALSCAAQYALLCYTAARLEDLFQHADEVCQSRFSELRAQWKEAPWDVGRCRYWVEVPEVHLHIQAFLATVKTFLDLIVQLVSTEGVVSTRVHGFHKRRDKVGGKLLNALNTRAQSAKSDVASRLREFLEKQKAVWIDQVVSARDGLAHPEKGMYQVVFALEIQADDADLKRLRILRPSINGQPFDEYAKETVNHVESFSRTFLRLLKAA